MGSCWSRGGRSPRQRIVGNFVVLLAVVSVLPWSAATADFAMDQWRYTKPFQMPAGLPAEGLVEAPVDREVFSHATAELADLRVVEGETTEVPYQLVVARGQRERQSHPVSIRDLRHIPEQYSSFVIDLGRDGILHNEVEIRTSSRNFQRQVTVEGSPDAETWAFLREEARIFDFSPRDGEFTSRHTRVQYPDSTARYLRVRITNDGEGPLEVQDASVLSVMEKPSRETEYSSTILSQSEDPQRRATVVTVDLGMAGLPTSRLAVQTSLVNFYRTVSLEGSNDGENWSSVQRSGALYSYDTPRFQGSQLSVSYPEVTYRYFRLTVHNEDNPPLEIQGVDLYGISRRLLFAATPGASYHLFYGNPDARKPSYDLGRFLPYLDTEDLPVATLGPQRQNPAFVVPQPPTSERLPWLIPVVVAVTAIAAGLLLFGVVRQARKVLPPPS